MGSLLYKHNKSIHKIMNDFGAKIKSSSNYFYEKITCKEVVNKSNPLVPDAKK